jgi:hypothetical protein
MQTLYTACSAVRSGVNSAPITGSSITRSDTAMTSCKYTSNKSQHYPYTCNLRMLLCACFFQSHQPVHTPSKSQKKPAGLRLANKHLHVELPIWLDHLRSCLSVMVSQLPSLRCNLPGYLLLTCSRFCRTCDRPPCCWHDTGYVVKLAHLQAVLLTTQMTSHKTSEQVVSTSDGHLVDLRPASVPAWWIFALSSICTATHSHQAL